jgi:hypothetical protein
VRRFTLYDRRTGCSVITRAITDSFINRSVSHEMQPDEHPLELGRGELIELNEALKQMKTPKRFAFRAFTIWPM